MKSQFDSENVKNPKTFHFSKVFYAFFAKFWTDFINCNVETGQQGKNFFHAVVFYEEIIAMFRMKMYQSDTENDKKPKNFHFSKFIRIFVQIFDGFCGLERGKMSTRRECVVQ